ncbi:MAG: 30S ribosomal protein S9 [Planctomycetota bacterium]
MSEATEHHWGTGRRKTAVARIRIRSGGGDFRVNERDMKEFFPSVQDQLVVNAPLKTANVEGKYDVKVRVNGGGPSGQSGAIALGLARALLRAEPNLEEALRAGGFLTRDARMKERKKYGQRGARRRFQFSKR